MTKSQNVTIRGYAVYIFIYIPFNPIRELQNNVQQRIDQFVKQSETSNNVLNNRIGSSNNSTPKNVCKLTFNRYPEYKLKQSVFKIHNGNISDSSIYRC